jgi:tRNA(Ile)-lysidine synthase TilS/MesJ
LALGHHLDDIVATLLMNMAQHGKFAGMAVRIDLTVGEQDYPIQLIRPLCYIREDDIRIFAAEQGYRAEKCRCDWCDDGVRGKTIETIEILAAFDPTARLNLFKAQFRIGQAEPRPMFDVEDTDVDCNARGAQ